MIEKLRGKPYEQYVGKKSSPLGSASKMGSHWKRTAEGKFTTTT